MSELTLIIPAKNEKEALPIFLDEIEKYNFRKIIVVDTNDQETQNAIKNYKNINIIRQEKAGYGNALIEGIKNCNTKYCSIINADSSMDPKYLDEMLKMCQNKDFIFCSRYLKGAGSDDDDIITFFGNKLFSFIGKIMFGLNITDILFTYLLGKTESFKRLDLKYHDFRICVEIPIKVAKFKMIYDSLPSFERKRKGGVKKVNAIKDGFLILIAILKLFFVQK